MSPKRTRAGRKATPRHLDYLLVEFTHRGIPLSKTLRNLETFATKVMPRFVSDS